MSVLNRYDRINKILSESREKGLSVKETAMALVDSGIGFLLEVKKADDIRKAVSEASDFWIYINAPIFSINTGANNKDLYEILNEERVRRFGVLIDTLTSPFLLDVEKPTRINDEYNLKGYVSKGRFPTKIHSQMLRRLFEKLRIPEEPYATDPLKLMIRSGESYHDIAHDFSKGSTTMIDFPFNLFEYPKNFEANVPISHTGCWLELLRNGQNIGDWYWGIQKHELRAF